VRHIGLSYREVAEIMNDRGYKMTHATARNIEIRAIEILRQELNEELYDGTKKLPPITDEEWRVWQELLENWYV